MALRQIDNKITTKRDINVNSNIHGKRRNTLKEEIDAEKAIFHADNVNDQENIKEQRPKKSSKQKLDFLDLFTNDDHDKEPKSPQSSLQISQTILNLENEKEMEGELTIQNNRSNRQNNLKGIDLNTNEIISNVSNETSSILITRKIKHVGQSRRKRMKQLEIEMDDNNEVAKESGTDEIQETKVHTERRVLSKIISKQALSQIIKEPEIQEVDYKIHDIKPIIELFEDEDPATNNNIRITRKRSANCPIKYSDEISDVEIEDEDNKSDVDIYQFKDTDTKRKRARKTSKVKKSVVRIENKSVSGKTEHLNRKKPARKINKTVKLELINQEEIHKAYKEQQEIKKHKLVVERVSRENSQSEQIEFD